MAYLNIEQRSPEWWIYKAGKISSTKFGQLISDRENSLVEELANETLDGYIEPSDYINEEMQYGIDNEELAIDKYEAKIGIKFIRGGVLQSDEHSILMASPDAISEDLSIIVEVKCTTTGATQLRRFTKGVDSIYIPQILNYFAVLPALKEVRWVSFCEFRPERPLVEHIFTRDTILDIKDYKTKPSIITTVQSEVDKGLSRLPQVEKDVAMLIEDFHEFNF